MQWIRCTRAKSNSFSATIHGCQRNRNYSVHLISGVSLLFWGGFYWCF